MKHSTKILGIIISATLLLTACEAQKPSSAPLSADLESSSTQTSEQAEQTSEQEEQTTEQAEQTSEQTAEPIEPTVEQTALNNANTAQRLEYADEYTKFSLNGGIFGYEFDEQAAVGDYVGWQAGDSDMYASLSYGEVQEYDWISEAASEEKTDGGLALDYLDIEQTDSGQEIAAYSVYIYGEESGDIVYGLISDCGNGRGIYINIIVPTEQNTSETLEEVLALFRSLEWQAIGEAPKNEIFEFEDLSFMLSIPRDVEFTREENEVDSAYERTVQLAGAAGSSDTKISDISYIECNDDQSFEGYEMAYLRDIEEKSGGTITIVDELSPFQTKNPKQRAYKWAYRCEGHLFSAAYFLIDDTTWVLVNYLVGDESRKEELEKSFETFMLLSAPIKTNELDLSDSERPEVTRVKADCRSVVLRNDYNVNFLHTGVVGLFGCPIDVSGEVKSGTKLVFTYDPERLNGIKPKGLIILHYNEADAWYDTYPSELNEEKCTVTAEISEGGSYLLADAYEWYRVWGEEIEELAHDVVFRCEEMQPNFSITVPSGVEYSPCMDYMKDSWEEGQREKSLVAGGSTLDVQRMGVVVEMTYIERTDDLTYDENIEALREICEQSDLYHIYEDSEDFPIFYSRIEDGDYGTGSVWGLIKVNDSAWVNISYTYVYDMIEEFEPKAIASLKSFKWE